MSPGLPHIGVEKIYFNSSFSNLHFAVNLLSIRVSNEYRLNINKHVDCENGDESFTVTWDTFRNPSDTGQNK